MLFALLVNLTEAKPFANTYISFDIPDDWQCNLEVTEFVCRPPADSNGKYSMIAILTAKEVGETDSPQLYIQHLQDDVGSTAGVETVRAPTSTLLGQAIWLDATYLNSEVKNYQTRYLARTEGNLGVLVTFSAHRSVVDQAQSISDGIAKSVQVNSYLARPELNQDRR
ncbi:hypothetical protein BG60_09330 [Caballeronia zhejiangensis]|uniref:DUF1795 domain-containing protein n=2 Tax=Burkholderiales TaxID=80840 RepID=A0A656QEI9_9BURK|nr:hypothetical protein BG58_28405 [Caballeronia jiangsuensis]KDR28799.1 hypothetical protein BG60_09330 [Caballeronia zhejiangensis]KWU19214.1 hypothetical protein AS149_13295 [Burkholderia cenocepacia]